MDFRIYPPPLIWTPRLLDFRKISHPPTIWTLLLLSTKEYALKWRLDQVSPMNICHVQQYLWQTFQGVCETRWRLGRSSDKEETALFEKYEKRKEEDKRVEAIGGTLSDFITLFEANVEDTITGEKNLQQENASRWC